MKLGTETGSPVNHVLSGHVGGPVPAVGVGATVLGWTDRYPATVTVVSPSGKTVTVREDHAVRTDSNGLSESQTYSFSPNPNGREFTFRLGKRGWKLLGGGLALRIGDRSKYHDFSF